MGNEELKTELIAYCHKMLERGDSWRSIRGYLNQKTDNEELIGEIITALNKLEANGHVKKPELEKSNKNTVLGFVIMGIGVFTFSFLWHNGWFAVLPIVIFGIGLKVLNGL